MIGELFFSIFLLLHSEGYLGKKKMLEIFTQKWQKPAEIFIKVVIALWLVKCEWNCENFEVSLFRSLKKVINLSIILHVYGTTG